MIWGAARFFEQRQEPPGAPVEQPAADAAQLRLEADGEAWVCVVDGREFREQVALQSYLAAEHAGRRAVIRSREIRDGVRIAPAIEACRDAGLDPVDLQLTRDGDEP